MFAQDSPARCNVLHLVCLQINFTAGEFFRCHNSMGPRYSSSAGEKISLMSVTGCPSAQKMYSLPQKGPSCPNFLHIQEGVSVRICRFVDTTVTRYSNRADVSYGLRTAEVHVQCIVMAGLGLLCCSRQDT